ncbi:MAG TPA: hypothetical protein VJ922_06775 [Actinomycetota bacterium]|nr:hypothetical protein [Actinomycetota bacterium]
MPDSRPGVTLLAIDASTSGETAVPLGGTPPYGAYRSGGWMGAIPRLMQRISFTLWYRTYVIDLDGDAVTVYRATRRQGRRGRVVRSAPRARVVVSSYVEEPDDTIPKNRFEAAIERVLFGTDYFLGDVEMALSFPEGAELRVTVPGHQRDRARAVRDGLDQGA